jgi:hypothetical protein
LPPLTPEQIAALRARDTDELETARRKNDLITIERMGRHPYAQPAVKTEESKEPPPTFSVRVTSIPPGAEVQVDGEYWGSTPTQELTRLREGTHTILVKSLGHEPWERKITFTAGEERIVHADLEPKQADPNKPRIAGLN